jgi:hypothetical protein
MAISQILRIPPRDRTRGDPEPQVAQVSSDLVAPKQDFEGPYPLSRSRLLDPHLHETSTFLLFTVHDDQRGPSGDIINSSPLDPSLPRPLHRKLSCLYPPAPPPKVPRHKVCMIHSSSESGMLSILKLEFLVVFALSLHGHIVLALV